MTLRDEGDFHASAFILGPDDTTVLIKDGRQLMKGLTPLWKFPGGKKKKTERFFDGMRDEFPVETVIREVKEETGLTIKKRHTKHVFTHRVGSGTGHNKHLFFSRKHSFGKLVPESKEYEIARTFPISELDELPDFHETYRRYFLEHIKPILEKIQAGAR